MEREPSRSTPDPDVTAEHEEAVARGEKRVLRRTTDGRLHSFPADEIGFSPGRGQAQVRTWWGMAVLATVMALLTLGSLWMLLAPIGQGETPEWYALWGLVPGALFTWYAVRLARDEYLAVRVRRERGSPEPGA
ncbi:hypothetical protein GCM10023258_24040 [Terrabacter aeriphilus]|uniref:Uncharacterized protein n=1 Tax=Terrabacter aeriphilus TaxID=515662 RepID=A0ABP9JDG0_9MICO